MEDPVTAEGADIGEWFAALSAKAADHDQAINDAWQQLTRNGWVSKVTVHRYLCRKCDSKLVVVIRLDRTTLAWVKDYKLAAGLNKRVSTADGRARNTLDGDRHWPPCVYDVDQLARFGSVAGFHVHCRHVATVIRARDVLAVTQNVRPGHPGPPTFL